MLKRVCCKCEKLMGFKDDGKKETTITHTYCPKCFEAEIKIIDQHIIENERKVNHG
jgi:hypothetical protein